jgi:undecaprenyl-diphosphatase
VSSLIALLNRHDERCLHFLVTRRYRALDVVMRTITHLADPAPAVLIVLALVFSDRWQGAGQRGLFGLVVSHLLVQILKRCCCRSRPALPPGIHSLVRTPDRFSFPSGHSAAGMSVALMAAAVLPAPFSIIVIVLAFGIGIARSYLGVHYPGDVIAGWILANVAYLAGSYLL